MSLINSIVKKTFFTQQFPTIFDHGIFLFIGQRDLFIHGRALEKWASSILIWFHLWNTYVHSSRSWIKSAITPCPSDQKWFPNHWLQTFPPFNCYALLSAWLTWLGAYMPHPLLSLLGSRTWLQTSGFQSAGKQLGNAYSVLTTSRRLSRLKNKLFLSPEERGGHRETAVPKIGVKWTGTEDRLIRAETRERNLPKTSAVPGIDQAPERQLTNCWRRPVDKSWLKICSGGWSWGEVLWDLLSGVWPDSHSKH